MNEIVDSCRRLLDVFIDSTDRMEIACLEEAEIEINNLQGFCRCEFCQPLSVAGADSSRSLNLNATFPSAHFLEFSWTYSICYSYSPLIDSIPLPLNSRQGQQGRVKLGRKGRAQ